MNKSSYFFFPLCFLVSSSWVCAQMVVQQGSLVTNPTARMAVKSSLLNNGHVSHRGTLSVSGNFINRQHFFEDGSTLRLDGQDQAIETIDQAIGTLVTAGNGPKKIIGNLSVQQTLQFEQGVVVPEGILTVASAASIAGGSSTSYVDGFLYHAGTGQKFYPVGKDGTYAPATLLNVTGNNPTVGIAYFPSAKLNGTEFHWQQSVINGTYDGSAAELTFTSDHPDYREYSNELLVLGGEDGSSQYTVLGQSSLNLREDRFTITSDQATTLPILTVGFDIPEDTKHLYLPNAFSPTAPNAEDRCIKVYGQKISSRNFYLAIQDVWGSIVYETTSREAASAQGWTGSSNTSGVAATYRYRLEGEFIGGKRFQQTGTIVQY